VFVDALALGCQETLGTINEDLLAGMKTAVAHLEPQMDEVYDDSGKVRIVLATAKGDAFEGLRLMDTTMTTKRDGAVNTDSPAVVYGYFPEMSEGEDVVLLAESRPGAAEWFRCTFPRQQRDRFLCISDFIRRPSAARLRYCPSNWQPWAADRGLRQRVVRRQLLPRLPRGARYPQRVEEYFTLGYRGARYSFGHGAAQIWRTSRRCTTRRPGTSMSDGLRAVLWDMDGTLVDSEKLWDISLQALYARLGGELTPEVREATVGGSAEGVMRIVYADLGLDPDPVAMEDAAVWLHDYTGELFEGGLPWLPGARELLDGLTEAGVPMALVTNTRRGLTERALKSIGHHYFSVSVCGDEVEHAKPAPDPYLRAAHLLGVEPGECLAVEDSPTGSAAAEAAGCPVVVVPNDVEVPSSPRRRHVDSLGGLDVDALRAIHAELNPDVDFATAERI
jgi:HAD superfamily hydrolase (TIGR01509 family)